MNLLEVPIQGFVYCLENMITHKKYIGSTINMSARFSQHIRLALNGKKSNLYDDMRKYGVDNFKMYPITKSIIINNEDCIGVLTDAEEKMIEKYNTARNGYNTLTKFDHLTDDDKRTIIETYTNGEHNMTKLSRSLGFDRHAMVRILKNENLYETNDCRALKPIAMLDSRFNILNIFESRSACMHYLIDHGYAHSFVATDLKLVAEGKKKQAYGFNFRYVDLEDPNNPKIIKNCRDK